MAKLSQAEIKTKADEWASYKKKIEKLEASKSEELVEFEQQYKAATAEIDAAYAPKILSLRAKADAIEAEVIAWLKELKKPIALCGQLADAVNQTKIGNRVIDPRKFYELAKDKFFDCITVGVKKAEEVIGKHKVDEISTKPETLESILRLK